MNQPLNVKEFNWQALNNALKAIAARINFNCPIEGIGIRIEESENGKIISISQDSTAQSPGAQSAGGGQQQGPDADDFLPDGTPASWQTLAVIDNSSGACVTKIITYWGGPAE